MPTISSATTPPAQATTSVLQQRYVQFAACLGFALVLLDVSVVNVALDSLSTAFHSGMTGLQWVVNAYALVFAALLLSAGSLGDRLGAKRVFMLGFSCFTVASLLCGLATGMPVLIAARALQGLGAALLVPNSLALLQQVFPDSAQRSRAVGWWGAAGGGAALAAGPVLGGLLVTWTSWRGIFLVNLPVGLLGLWLTYRHAPSSTLSSALKGRSFDIAGQITAIAALGSLTFALTEASRQGWSAAPVIACLAIFVACAALFIRIERQSASPMLPLSLFQNSTVSASAVIGLLINFAFYGMVFILSLFFSRIRHFDAQQTGFSFLPMMGVLVLTNLLAGPLSNRIGARQLTVAGLMLGALGYLLLLPTNSSSPYALMIVPMLLSGVGISLTIPVITNATLSSVARSQAGIGSGLLNSARQVGGVLGVAVFGFLAQGEDSAQFMWGMHCAMALSTVLLALGAVLGHRYIK